MYQTVMSPLAGQISSRLRLLIFTVIVISGLFIVTGLAVDFTIYYDAAKLTLSGEGSAYYPYDIGESFIYHPFILSLLSPFTWLPLSLAFITWTILSAIGFAWVLYRLDEKRWQLWWLLWLVWVPVVETFYNGQINIFILCALLACYLFYQSERHILAGIALACAIIIKLTPIILLGYFVATRKWKIVLIAVLTLALMFLISILQFGSDPLIDFITVTRLSSGAPPIRFHNLSVYMLLVQYLPVSPNIIYEVYKFCVILILMSLTILTFFAPSHVHGTIFHIFIVLAVILTPIVWVHHFILFLLPLWHIMQKAPQAILIRMLFILPSIQRLLELIFALFIISNVALAGIANGIIAYILRLPGILLAGWLLYALFQIMKRDWSLDKSNQEIAQHTGN